MAAANDPKQAYEKRTKDYFRPKSGLGLLNDINLGALYRFGKENFGKNATGFVKGLIKPNTDGDFGIVGAKDKYGQSTSTVESFGLNSLENLVSPPPNYTAKSGINDVRQLAYFVGKLSPYMLALDGIELGNYGYKKYVEEMAKRYTKMPKGPNSAYQFILDKFKG